MLLSEIFSVVCFLSALMIHLITTFNFRHPPEKILTMVGYWSLLILLYPALYELKLLKQGFATENFKKAMRDFLTKWKLYVLAFFFFYAITHVIYYLVLFKKSDLPTDNNTYLWDIKYRTLSSVWMAQHFLIFICLCGIRYLKKRKASTETKNTAPNL